MLTPADKIKNGKNDIIQIFITHKCSVFSCSNCTQLLPFRKDTAEMSLECFEKAVKSLDGFPGVASLFGGDPTCHSRFDEICHMFVKLRPKPEQRGFWCNDVLRHGQIAADTFSKSRTNFNVHGDKKAADRFREFFPHSPIYGESGRNHHGQILGFYKDYGIPESEWIEKRETCDINQNWSALIREVDGEPYVYFCEVAASIDGVRGVNHGIKAEPGWWQWPIERFQDQIANCCDNGCIVPLKLQGHEDREDVYDISPSWKNELSDSKLVSVQVHENLPPMVHELTDYVGLRLKTKP